MNWLGKTLTLLIFLMSVCFLVLSVMLGAAHRNWKIEAENFRARAKEYQLAADDAKAQIGRKDLTLEVERVARQRQLAQLESRLKIAIDDLRDRETKWKTEQANNADLLTKLNSTNQRLADQDKEVAELKETNSKLAADVTNSVALVQNLTNEKYELENQLYDLKKLQADLTASLAQKTKVMKSVGISDTDPTDHIVPPLDGVVRNVNADRKLVGIGLGSDDGLRVGHEMDVYRNDKYIGKIRVTKTDFNVAVAEVIPDFMQDQIREGDHVTSRL
jgi:predicted  nucleic acid-binding Zn-ribbon protein